MALYANTTGHGYSIDDEAVTNDNVVTGRGVAAIPEIFSSNHWDFAGRQFGYRPVTKSTFALEHQLFGANPRAGHAINVALYAATVVVLFLLLRDVFGATGAFVPFVASLLFLAHPIHTEVVCNLKSRDELLALLFGLGSAMSFLEYFRRRRGAWLAAGAAAFVVAIMSKMSALPFAALVPLVLAASGRVPLRGIVAVAIGLPLISAAYLGTVTTFLPGLLRDASYVENPLVVESDLWFRFGAALDTLLFYLRKLLLPHPLAFYYGYDTIELSALPAPKPLLSLLVHSALAIYVLRHVRALNGLAFGLAWYLIGIAMYSNLVVSTTGIVAERAAYVASVGFAVAAASLAARLGGIEPLRVGSGRAATAVIVALALLVAGYSAKVVKRNGDWRDVFTILEADIGRLDRSVMAHYIYARELRHAYADREPSATRTQRLTQAIERARWATDLLPTFAPGHNLVGSILLYDLDDSEQAIVHLARASDLSADLARAHYDALYGNVVLGRLDAALEYGLRLMRVDADHLMGLYYLSKLYFQRGEREQAFAYNRRLQALAPERDLAYINFGYFYYEQGDVERAVASFERALEIAPDNAPVARDLAGILADAGMVERSKYYEALADRAQASRDSSMRSSSTSSR